ncbi:hypothetical protein HY041_00325 [Candidatus Roizmanbacteria bacterium]|nr:hypothetical protein [Candidatus Roizmanbacteria bacterium]
MRQYIFFFFVFFFLLIPKIVFAQVPNNKFGIHLAQPHHEDLKKAREMVNANGGDWGYVTLVMQEDDKNKEKWQEIFDLIREYHLIPIIRIATHPEGAHWRRPAKEEAQSWVDFLNSLHWVVKNRYVILFNEPNHGSEWGGMVDAYDFAESTKEFAEKLKAKNPDFFIMLGAIDASAPTSMPNYLGEEYFFENYFQKVTIQDFERLFDGLASHSYPNPAFSGTPWNTGRGTVKSYEWELGLLGRLGVNKKLPVFITETGWSADRLSRDTIASYFQIAYQNMWLLDDRVVAVTPFVFDYQGEPFLNFSWKMYQNEEYYPQYYTVQSLSKTKGEPEQIDTGEFLVDLPKELVANSNYHFKVKLRNRGQAIWDKKWNYELKIINYERTTLEYFASDIKSIRPYEETDTDLYIKTNDVVGKNSGKVVLAKDNKVILGIERWSFEIVPLPSLTFNVSLYPKLLTNGEQFEIQLFDEKEELVFKRGGIRVTRGIGRVKDVQNIIPGKKYRIVILNQYYLPRQSFITFHRGENIIRFKPMLPFDFNQNGHLDWGDFNKLIQNLKLIQLLFP